MSSSFHHARRASARSSFAALRRALRSQVHTSLALALTAACTASEAPADGQPVLLLDGGAQADAAPSPASAQQADAGAVGSDAGAASGLGGFCEARKVLQRYCSACHARPSLAGAPMPLLTAADLLAPSPYFPEQTVLQRVQARIHDTKRPMPPAGGLDAATLAPLEAWLAADSHTDERAENCTESVPPPQVVPWPVECDDVYELRSHDPSDPRKPFAVPADQELQKGVALSLPWGDSPVQALAIRPLLDNTRIVHHWVLASGEPDAPFGKWLWGWAPGVGPSALLPDDVGMEIPAGPLNLNMHYYNIGGPATSDTSGLEVCVTRRFRKYTAAVGMDFNSFPVAIPPRQRSESEGECRVVTTTDEPLHVLALAPHMHKLGAHMRVAVVHEGVERVIHDADYNFTDQGYYPQNDVIIHDGDIVRTRCTYQNDTDKVVSSGESSDEEMCVAFALHWPAHAYLCAPL